MNTAKIGTVSHGTLRTEDLLDSFAFELEALVQRNAETWCSDDGRKARDRYMALIGDAREVDPDSEDASEIVEELTDALNEFAPDYTYFGAHPGDGSDFGFWPIEDLVQQAKDDGTLVVSDLSEVPDDYRGLLLVVNDHGNVTCCTIDTADIRRELWSCV